MIRNRRRNKVALDRAVSRMEPLEDRLLMAVFTVTNTNDSGTGSLRWAISQTGTVPGLNTVAFNITSADKTIHTLSSLSCWSPVIIDATTQPGYAGKPLVTIDGSGAGNNDGFQLGGGCTLKGLDIIRFNGSGISCTTTTGAGGNVVQANWIGVDLNGNAAHNAGHGIGAYTPNNLIGGPNKTDGNVIADNGGYGVFILAGLFGSDAHGNVVQNNLITGDYNGVGVQGAPGAQILSNLISGSVEVSEDAAGNGNGGDGILLTGSTTGTIIRGNLIGTDATGTTANPNQQYGIEIQTSGNTVQGNTISGNRKAGIVFYSGSANTNSVKGNFIGTDLTGTRPLGNQQQGIAFASAGANQIGGPNAGDGNVIAANIGQGIAIFPGNGEVIQGNRIGIGVNGEHLGNHLEGIVGYGSSGTVISSNIIAYNVNSGIGSIDAGADKGNNQIFGNNGQIVTVPPVLQSAVSRRLQGSTAFDIALPLSGTPAIECRNVGSGMTLVLTFDKAITSASAVVSAGSATIGSVTASGNTLSINLSNVANAQTLTISATNIVAADGGTAASAPVSVRLLEGDVNGSGTVSAADIATVKYNVSQSISAANFRADLNGNGLITASDVARCKYLIATAPALPAAAPALAAAAIAFSGNGRGSLLPTLANSASLLA